MASPPRRGRRAKRPTPKPPAQAASPEPTSPIPTSAVPTSAVPTSRVPPALVKRRETDVPGAPPPIVRHPMVRAGIYAWSIVGIAIVSMAALFVIGQLRLVVVPLVLALFPAALLAPVYRVVRRTGIPAALSSLLVLLGSLGILVGVGFFLVPQVVDEAPRLTAQVQSGLNQLQAFLETGPLGLDPEVVTNALDNLQTTIAESDILRTGVLGAAGAVAEIVTMLLLLLVVLFFYLKDGTRIATWLRSLFPVTVQEDVAEIGTRGWNTVGAYFRGQIFVALVDGVFIGIGLALLRVPLALPLGVLVFFASLFPIVGAILSGIVAVLVALAAGGPTLALFTLLLVIGVQQLESNVLAPLVLGKATALHPLAVLTSLTAGGILLGVLGAFLAVPVAASLARGVGYLREKRRVEEAATPHPVDSS